MTRAPRQRSPTRDGNDAGVPRFAVDALGVGGITLRGDSAHHLSHVLRLGHGAAVLLFDRNGHEALARIARVGRDEVEAQVTSVIRRPALPLAVTVALPAPRGERADWVVEKLTEVGVSRILWLLSERSVTKPDPRGGRPARWERIARAAAAQSERVGWPVVEGPISFAVFLTSGDERRLIADQSGEWMGAQGSMAAGRSVTLGIGPEGGFSARELAAATAAGFFCVRLSPNILRVETAAVVGAAMLLSLPRVTP